MPRLVRPLVWALVGVALLASSCVDDPRELESADLRRIIERSLEEADQANALHFTDGEAACVAGRVMRAISDDRLEDLGVDEGFGLSTLDFTSEEEDTVFAALEACVDLVAQVADTIGTDTGLTADEARCTAAGYVASDPFREAIFADDFDQALNERIDAALALAGKACGRSAPV